MDNSTLIGWGIFIIILWIGWIAYLILKKLHGEGKFYI